MRVRGQGSCRCRLGQSRWQRRANPHRRVAVAFSAVLVSFVGGFFPTWAAGTGLKAMWGPATRDGVSLFPIYRELGVKIYEDDLRWNLIAPTRPDHPRNPRDPAYAWPGEVTHAVREAHRTA